MSDIWLGSFHFIKKHEIITNKGGRKIKSWITEELISEPFILGNEPNKCKDTLYIGRALKTKGISKTDKTAYEKWNGEDVKISCKLIRKVNGL